MERSLFDRALHFAIDAHAGMARRSAGQPYILHPLEVAAIVSTMSTDEELLAAAVLHDTVEDTPTTIEDIEERFGARVAAFVSVDTEDKREDLPASETWRIRKEESLEVLASASRDEKILWLSDKLSNMRSFLCLHRAQGHAFWNGFNQKDPYQQAWYYRTIRDLLSELRGEAAWQEYAWLVEQVFCDLDGDVGAAGEGNTAGEVGAAGEGNTDE